MKEGLWKAAFVADNYAPSSMDDINEAANEDVMNNLPRSPYVNCDFDCTEVFVKRSKACLVVIRQFPRSWLLDLPTLLSRGRSFF